MLDGSDFRVWAPRHRRSAQHPSSSVLRFRDLAARCRVDAATRDFLGVSPALIGLDTLLPVDAVLIVDGVVDHPEVIGGTQMVLLSVDHAKGALLDARSDLRAD